ncbi:EF-hand domain pair [Cinara cedri]|uniref:EF-hand domain pair n=1 Tax=Cinara cedri TaxID=506608 RepID=A0A5E4N760_9HEMI|nr:EF-hand domain pair [Cinara cedri]
MMDDYITQNPKYLQVQKECIEQYRNKRYSISPYRHPLKPKHYTDKKNTTCRDKSITISIGDVIFPDKSTEINCSTGIVEDENKTTAEFCTNISKSGFGIGEQSNRKYTANFNPDNRYGKREKYLPPGVWYKWHVKSKSSWTADDKKTIFENYLNRLLERIENNECIRYPYIDEHQGKSTGRPYFGAVSILTRSYPNEKEFEFNECLSTINKIKSISKKKKFNVWELREACKKLDKAGTGWLPLEQMYEICCQRQFGLEKKMFNFALKLIHAVDDNNVQYDLFVDLIDWNVQFSPSCEKRDTASKTENDNKFVTTYENEYKNKLSQSVKLNKKYYSYDPLAYKMDAPDRDFFFGPESNVKMLLNPSIFTLYGLTHRDFYEGRSKLVMEKLFRDVGVNLPSKIFDVVWDNAYRCDGVDDKVSIEVFRQALQELAESKMVTDNRD